MPSLSLNTLHIAPLFKTARPMFGGKRDPHLGLTPTQREVAVSMVNGLTLPFTNKRTLQTHTEAITGAVIRKSQDTNPQSPWLVEMNNAVRNQRFPLVVRALCENAADWALQAEPIEAILPPLILTPGEKTAFSKLCPTIIVPDSQVSNLGQSATRRHRETGFQKVAVSLSQVSEVQNLYQAFEARQAVTASAMFIAFAHRFKDQWFPKQ
jgi:hypothetical protein